MTEKIINDRFKFLQALFDDDDKVAFGMCKETSNKPVDPLPHFLHTDGLMFCINPLTEWRNTKNVTKIQSLLFECDDTNLTIRDQIKLFIKSGLPFTTMTTSGKKSVHVIVRLIEPIEDALWQKQWWKAIETALLKHGIVADFRARLIPQLSRIPGGMRNVEIEDDEGQSYNIINQQKLVFIRDRVSQSEMKQWLAKNNIEVQTPKVPEPSTYVPGANDAVDNKQKFDTAKKWVTEKQGLYSSSTTTGGHSWLFEFGIKCWSVDLNLDAAISMAELEWGTRYLGSNGGGNTNFPLKAGWLFGHNNNIKKYEFKQKREFTDEEKQEWLKQKRIKELKQNELNLINRI